MQQKLVSDLSVIIIDFLNGIFLCYFRLMYTTFPMHKTIGFLQNYPFPSMKKRIKIQETFGIFQKLLLMFSNFFCYCTGC